MCKPVTCAPTGGKGHVHPGGGCAHQEGVCLVGLRARCGAAGVELTL